MIWVVFVTFERTDVPNEILDDESLGACGWMAVEAETEKEAYAHLKAGLAQENLKLIEAEDFDIVGADDDISELDEHLALNVENWEDGKKTVWGSIYEYTEDGDEEEEYEEYELDDEE